MSLAFMLKDDSGEWERSPSQDVIDAERERFVREQDERLASRAAVNIAKRNVASALADLRALSSC